MSEEVITTCEFVKNAKHLYRTALRFAKARIAHARTLKNEDWEEAARCFQLLRTIDVLEGRQKLGKPESQTNNN